MAPVRKIKAKKAKAEVEAIEEEPVVSGQLAKKMKKQQQRKENERGVVFIKHLPHGFFEQQLKAYFSQFGRVTRLRLARSKRTGGSKGFAFVEFEYPEVAQVAAQTMDNYLMFKKLIKASYIPPEKQVYNYFKTSVRHVKNKAGKMILVSSRTRAIQKHVQHNNDWSHENYLKRTKAGLKKLQKLNKKYAHLGIDFHELAMLPKGYVKKGDAEKPAKESEKDSATENSALQTSNESLGQKSPKLEDLMGTTLNDDSDDSDFVVDEEEAENESGDTSDEETYGFTKEQDDEEKSVSGSDESESLSAPVTKNLVKVPKVDRMEQLLVRKPQGGIKKSKKKPATSKKSSKAKNKLVLEAAKSVAKPLAKNAKKSKGTRKGKA